MEDEEPSEKTSRRDRWRFTLSRTKTKSKDHSRDTEKKDFQLSDDVNDFLQAGRPSTSDLNARRLETPPDKLLYPEVDHDRPVQAGSPSMAQTEHRNMTPPKPMSATQRSLRGIPIPRLDVSGSQRWPGQQELRDPRAQGTDDFLRPAPQEQPARSRSQGPIPGRRKGNRPRNLSVAFIEAPPVIIGEGGDEAEAPTIEIGRIRSRARSVSPMPGKGREKCPQQGTRQGRTVIGSTDSASTVSPQDFRPQRLVRVQTGMVPTLAASKNIADVEFEMTLQAPTPVTATRGPSPQRRPTRGVSPARPNRKSLSTPSPLDCTCEDDAHESVQTNYTQYPLHPAAAKDELRMQFEEGQALRHSHYRSLSNASITESDKALVSPNLRQPSPNANDNKHIATSERKLSEVSPISPEDQPGGWI